MDITSVKQQPLMNTEFSASNLSTEPDELSIEDMIRMLLIDGWQREILLSEGGWPEEKQLEW